LETETETKSATLQTEAERDSIKNNWSPEIDDCFVLSCANFYAEKHASI